ncbi:nickel pincer cofactor biosynthesis protein LarB [Ancylobacter mangrovi]|uniref:nickel pincer cofactor biosynthesis protein LarB n=1 Tax=Ancylobacter mangrovi TaxID=2972472 RepID=UPI0021638C29|nr:nickel pincer cofactor biosynthesis protein LarB [Ancylobacter mangrovi]MCS0500857.1 nickel pincer cofactor biosynthesis protein LarB [Ancylobacter mangrovi]
MSEPGGSHMDSDARRDLRMDWEREARTGMPEAVLCEPKSADQIDRIVAGAKTAGRALLLTRLSPEHHGLLAAQTRAALDYDALSATAIVPAAHGPAALIPGIGIVGAGSSDAPVAREAARTLTFCGFAAPTILDVGVAGIDRLLVNLPQIRSFDVVICVAGMEGALFSVLAGLVEAPVIAVPTSVGYGVAAGGTLALHSALGGCAPGVVAVNIDNGFGAAAAAIKIMKRTHRMVEAAPTDRTETAAR